MPLLLVLFLVATALSLFLVGAALVRYRAELRVKVSVWFFTIEFHGRND